MLAVQTNDTDREANVRSIWKEYGASKFEEFKEQWDPEVWSVFNEESPQVR